MMYSKLVNSKWLIILTSILFGFAFFPSDGVWRLIKSKIITPHEPNFVKEYFNTTKTPRQTLFACPPLEGAVYEQYWPARNASQREAGGKGEK